MDNVRFITYTHANIVNPLVSIVLPTYNGGRFLAESIDSVINQTYTNWELIIVNDCSTDNTLDIINEYVQKDSRIRVISNPTNMKLPASLNIGFENAKGKYYTWTSDDNIYKDNAIEFMVNYLEQNSCVDFVSCKYDIVEEDKTFAFEFFHTRFRKVTDLAKENNIGACFMYTADIAHKAGYYQDSMFCAEDYDYWCRIALLGNISYIDDNLYLYRINTKSLSATQQPIVRQRAEAIRLKYSIPILQKFEVSQDDIIKKLIKFYFERYNYKWITKAVEINVSKAIKFCFFELFKYLIRNLEQCCLSFLEELKFLLILHKYKNQKVAFWGASLFLEKFLKKYHIKNKNIIGIIDKDSKKWGKELCNYTIYSPEQIKDLDVNTIIFSIKNNNGKIYNLVKEQIYCQYSSVRLAPNIFTDMAKVFDRLMFKTGEKCIVDKLRHKKEKIRVCFLVSETAKWNAQILYDLMKNSNIFEPFIVVTNLQDARNRQSYSEILNFFKSCADNVEIGYDDNTKTSIDLREFSPDIVFYQQPWGLFSNQDIDYVSQFALTCHFPYAIEEVMRVIDYNSEKFYSKLWAWFVSTGGYKKQISKYMDKHFNNILVVGHPKLDVYNKYDEKQYVHKYVIYAPHHAITENSLKYSTFEWSGKYMLEWAQKHPEIEWIFKPHPGMKSVFIENGIMSEQEINQYYDEWRKIGQCYESGNYFDLFKQSKCLITDCGSFLTEYFPTRQPVIHLRNENATEYAYLNQKIMETYYKVWNIEELEQTLDRVLVKNIDTKKSARVKLLSKLFHDQFNSSSKIMNYLIKKLKKNRT